MNRSRNVMECADALVLKADEFGRRLKRFKQEKLDLPPVPAVVDQVSLSASATEPIATSFFAKGTFECCLDPGLHVSFQAIRESALWDEFNKALPVLGDVIAVDVENPHVVSKKKPLHGLLHFARLAKFEACHGERHQVKEASTSTSKDHRGNHPINPISSPAVPEVGLSSTGIMIVSALIHAYIYTRFIVVETDNPLKNQVCPTRIHMPCKRRTPEGEGGKEEREFGSMRRITTVPCYIVSLMPPIPALESKQKYFKFGRKSV
eukprot:g37722.t1